MVQDLNVYALTATLECGGDFSNNGFAIEITEQKLFKSTRIVLITILIQNLECMFYRTGQIVERTFSSTRSQRRKALTRQSPVESAKKLFAEEGFTGATVDDIVEYAYVAKVTFYYHFKSKEDIAIEIRRQCIFEPNEYVEELGRKDLPTAEMIAAFTSDVASWTEENGKLLDVFCSQRLNPFIEPRENDDDT